MKKSYILLVYTLFAFSFSIHGQVAPPPAIEWQKSLGHPSYWPPCINQTTDGGYIVAQSFDTLYENAQTSDVLLIKLNSAGAIQWQKTIGTGTTSEIVSAVKQITDGGYIMAGTSDNDYWITKLDASGAILWQKFFGGSVDEAANDIQETTDGGYIVTGHARSNDRDVTGNHGGTDYWIVKINASGNLEWQKTLGGSDDEAAFDIGQTTDGSYIVSGYTYSYDGDVTGNHPGLGDGWIVKLNSSGILQWQKCLGGSSTDVVNGMETTTDGGCIIAAPSSSFDGDVTGNHGNLDYWIVKLNSAGTIQWQKSFGGGSYENCSSIDLTSDGGYIVAGGAIANGGDVTGNHGGGGDYWIVKLNSSGDLQWQKCLGGTAGDNAFAVEQTTDNGYIIAGNSGSSDGDVADKQGDMDIWIVKLEPDALLPVTLINFSGEIQGKQNVLHWTTATEQNNIGFEIQRSNDAINFVKIGFINTKSMNGNSNANLDYVFTDRDYVTTTNYYMLKQIDKDGKFSYSNIVVIRNNNPLASGLFNIYPNPAKNILNVKIASAGNSTMTMVITDLNGKPLLNKITHVSNGENIVLFNVSKLPGGTYFLKVLSSDGKENAVKKFVKQ